MTANGKSTGHGNKLGSMVSVRLTPYEMELIRDAAAARQSSVSATLRRAVLNSVGQLDLPQHARTLGTVNAASTATRVAGNLAVPAGPTELLPQATTTHS